MDRIEDMLIFLRSMRSFAANKISIFCGIFFVVSSVYAQQSGGIRGTVYDKDYGVSLVGAQVLIAETGLKTAADDNGGFVLSKVVPGKYTLVFSKDGYARQVSSDVVVPEGQMTEVSSSLAGEYTEMDEFVVQDLQLGGGMESGLLNLRMESPALMDSVSSEMMSRAGAGDAAGALRLVAGATVQDGKYAVVRGLPDRYVNSQMNGVRLPSADPDKRAVQLDQFPSALIESIQVSKTFTPDQQGDASGGAVNVVLKGIPDKPVLEFKSGISYNSQTTGNDSFLSYKGGGTGYWGKDDGGRALPLDVKDAYKDTMPGIRTGRPFTAVKQAEYHERDRQTRLFSPVIGTSIGEAPAPGHSWEVTAGNSRTFDNGIRVGALGSFNYDHSYSFYENGRLDTYQGNTDAGEMQVQPDSEGRTQLYKDSEGTEEVLWSALGALGVEYGEQQISLIYMSTHAAQDTSRLLEDTAGVTNGSSGNYYRSQAIGYTERDTSTLQLIGRHKLPFPEPKIGNFMEFLQPEIDWTLAGSESALWEPDKRLFYTAWNPVQSNYMAADPNGTGIGRRSWVDISEESKQFFVNGKIPFKQWTDDEGYFKLGWFQDEVVRKSGQDSFTYKNGPGSVPAWIVSPVQPFENSWTDAFLNPDRIGIIGDFDPAFQNDMAWQVLKSGVDSDYDAAQNINAWYPMMDMPLFSMLNIIGGVRFETTDLKTDFRSSDGSGSARFIKDDGTGLLEVTSASSDAEIARVANTSLIQEDVLPSIGFLFEPIERLTFRGTYSETVARPTFKELTPAVQYEYLGSEPFVGNNELQMSALKNYDLRAEYYPNPQLFLSASWFSKKIQNPIEYQLDVAANSSFIRAVNYPEGELSGYELEARQRLGMFWSGLENFSIQGSATFIDSQVTLPENELHQYRVAGITPFTTRDMRETPAYLLNTSLLYDNEHSGTQVGIFYTIKGDTLVAGGSKKGNYYPDLYAEPYGELSASISQKIWTNWKVTLRAKNLLNPEIKTVYRSPYYDDEATHSSYTKGISYSASLGCEF